mmetsp:Transcript_25503/g.38996  ORF Transcript_25503/g.38996 Transcript_25503/m.38996 type:complete len:320 (+) Transcript_25503:224-1183(+)
MQSEPFPSPSQVPHISYLSPCYGCDGFFVPSQYLLFPYSIQHANDFPSHVVQVTCDVFSYNRQHTRRRLFSQVFQDLYVSVPFPSQRVESSLIPFFEFESLGLCSRKNFCLSHRIFFCTLLHLYGHQHALFPVHVAFVDLRISILPQDHDVFYLRHFGTLVNSYDSLLSSQDIVSHRLEQPISKRRTRAFVPPRVHVILSSNVDVERAPVLDTQNFLSFPLHIAFYNLRRHVPHPTYARNYCAFQSFPLHPFLLVPFAVFCPPYFGKQSFLFSLQRIFLHTPRCHALLTILVRTSHARFLFLFHASPPAQCVEFSPQHS